MISLITLTKIFEKLFIFPWNLKEPKQKVFDTFKKAFTITTILAHFNLDLETWVESDTLDYVVAAVLSQKHSDRILGPVTFILKKIFLAKYNYEIYNKKLLAIIQAFKNSISS